MIFLYKYPFGWASRVADDTEMHKFWRIQKPQLAVTLVPRSCPQIDTWCPHAISIKLWAPRSQLVRFHRLGLWLNPRGGKSGLLVCHHISKLFKVGTVLSGTVWSLYILEPWLSADISGFLNIIWYIYIWYIYIIYIYILWNYFMPFIKLYEFTQTISFPWSLSLWGMAL